MRFKHSSVIRLTRVFKSERGDLWEKLQKPSIIEMNSDFEKNQISRISSDC